MIDSVQGHRVVQAGLTEMHPPVQSLAQIIHEGDEGCLSPEPWHEARLAFQSGFQHALLS